MKIYIYTCICVCLFCDGVVVVWIIWCFGTVVYAKCGISCCVLNITCNVTDICVQLAAYHSVRRSTSLNEMADEIVKLRQN